MPRVQVVLACAGFCTAACVAQLSGLSCEDLSAVHRELDAHILDAGFHIGANGAHLGKAMEGSSTLNEGMHLCRLTRAAHAQWHAPTATQAGQSVDGKHGKFTVCQTGFNRGRSAVAFLLADAAVRVASFDLGEHPYVKVAQRWIDERPDFVGRHDLYLGNSAFGIPRAVKQRQVMRCDLVFVDGNHMEEGALEDILQFAGVAAPGATMLLDDCPMQVMVANAYQRACRQGLVVCPPDAGREPAAIWTGGGAEEGMHEWEVKGLCTGNYSSAPAVQRMASRRDTRAQSLYDAAPALLPVAGDPSSLRQAAGFCRATVAYSDCQQGMMGSYDQGPASRSLEKCVAACRKCDNCRCARRCPPRPPRPIAARA